VLDRGVLHDQSLSGRHRDAVLGDEEARDGAHGRRAGSTPPPVALLQHRDEPSQRPGPHRRLLRRASRHYRLPYPPGTTPTRPTLPSLPSSLPGKDANAADPDRSAAGLRQLSHTHRYMIGLPLTLTAALTTGEHYRAA